MAFSQLERPAVSGLQSPRAAVHPIRMIEDLDCQSGPEILPTIKQYKECTNPEKGPLSMGGGYGISLAWCKCENGTRHSLGQKYTNESGNPRIRW